MKRDSIYNELYLNIIMVICDKPITNIIFNGEKLKAIQGEKESCSLSPLLFNIV